MILDVLIPLEQDSIAPYVVQVVEEECLGIPRYLWDCILNVVSVLLVGLLLAWVASRYQKRKEVEWKLRGDLLQRRIGAYEKISQLLYELYQHVTTSPNEEKRILAMMEPLSIPEPDGNYVPMMENLDSMMAYKLKVENLMRSERIFLDYPVERMMDNFLVYLDTLQEMMESWKRINKHTEIGYRAIAIALCGDMTKWYCEFDLLLAEQMKNLELSVKSYRWTRRINEWLDNKMDEPKEKQWIKAKWYRDMWRQLAMGEWTLLDRGGDIVLLQYTVYYMNRIESVWDEKPEDMKKNLALFHAKLMGRA